MLSQREFEECEKLWKVVDGVLGDYTRDNWKDEAPDFSTQAVIQTVVIQLFRKSVVLNAIGSTKEELFRDLGQRGGPQA